jgi:nitrate reductase assembly molybdenum cofactor insertion protein NarJ
MSPLSRTQLEEAARWRLLSLLFERPSDGWRRQVQALAAEVPDPALRQAAAAAIAQATESAHCSLFGPGGPVPAREASCRPGIQLGYLLAEITGIYQAFGYRPAAEESPDHIAVETGFVAYLKLKQIHAECSGAAEEAQRCAEAAEYVLSAPFAVGFRRPGGA